MQIPKEVNEIIKKLQGNGYEAYCVGGCVRDSILGRVPEDWDITTSAMPEEVKRLFQKTVDTGIEHGTVTVLSKGKGYEVTTYRIDGKYEDSRHPTEVVFTRTLGEDLLRRDFTINAMAYNDKEGLVDIFEGMQDIEKKRIRCVGNAQERFSEDALRILRAIRFSAQLCFVIEDETKIAIKELSATLKKISVERIQVELVKLLLSDHPDYIHTAYTLGVTKVILPKWDEQMEKGEGESLLRLLSKVPKDKVLRLGVLLYGEPPSQAKALLKQLKFDNATINAVYRLLEFKDLHIKAEGYSVRKAMNQMGEEILGKHLVLKLAIASEEENQSESNRVKAIESLVKEIKEKNQCTHLKELAVSGKDLMGIGITPGKAMGDILQELLQVVLEKPEQNYKEKLLEIAQNMER